MLKCFSPALRAELRAVDWSRACDIRLFAEGPCVVRGGGEEFVSRYTLSAEELYETAQALCGRMLRLSPAATGEGFLPLRGGHRMGLCGRVSQEAEGLLLHELGSVCIRLAREVAGCGAALAACVRAGGGVLLAGAPGSGKTTMLRDAVRILSDDGRAVGLVDTRGEVAACLAGVPQLDVGLRTHVADGCGKAEGLRWLLRAMSPDLLAMDELYGSADCAAVREAAACGVPILATVHAGSAAQLCARRGVRGLLREGAVSRVVFLQERRIALVASSAEVLEAARLCRL